MRSPFLTRTLIRAGLGVSAAGLLAGGSAAAGAFGLATTVLASSQVAAKTTTPSSTAKHAPCPKNKDKPNGRAAGCHLHQVLAQAVFEADAKTLDMTPAELLQALKSGKSLKDLANAKGMNEDQFKAAMLENLKPILEADVDKHLITQAQAATFFDHLSKHKGVPGWNGKHPQHNGHHAPKTTPKA